MPEALSLFPDSLKLPIEAGRVALLANEARSEKLDRGAVRAVMDGDSLFDGVKVSESNSPPSALYSIAILDAVAVVTQEFIATEEMLIGFHGNIPEPITADPGYLDGLVVVPASVLLKALPYYQ